MNVNDTQFHKKNRIASKILIPAEQANFFGADFDIVCKEWSNTKYLDILK